MPSHECHWALVMTNHYCLCCHIWGHTKWSPLCRRHVEIHFLDWNIYCFRLKFHKHCFLEVSIPSIGSGNGSASIRRQAIIWTNDGLGPVSLKLFLTEFKFDENLICSHLNSKRMIVAIFFTWHTSCAFVTCAKHCSDMIARKSIVTILITLEKSLVKWAPGLRPRST